MVRVVLTRRAASELREIGDYVAQFNPLAAQRVAARLLSAAEALANLPERGRPIGGGRRELTLIRPYLIRYRVDGESVIITEIRHGARRPE